MSSEIARVIIKKFLGDYLENIDSENIAVGVSLILFYFVDYRSGQEILVSKTSK